MRKIAGVIICTSTLLSLAYAAESSVAWQPLRASYTIFSGPILADREAATPQDRKLAIAVEGPAAKEIFDSIGPDSKEMCSRTKGDRERDKGGVQCTYTKQLIGSKTGAYRCWVSVNLITGESVGTLSC